MGSNDLASRIRNLESRFDALEDLVHKNLLLHTKLADLQIKLGSQGITKDEVNVTFKSWFLQDKITVDEYRLIVDVLLKIK